MVYINGRVHKIVGLVKTEKTMVKYKHQKRSSGDPSYLIRIVDCVFCPLKKGVSQVMTQRKKSLFQAYMFLALGIIVLSTKNKFSRLKKERSFINV